MLVTLVTVVTSSRVFLFKMHGRRWYFVLYKARVSSTHHRRSYEHAAYPLAALNANLTFRFIIVWGGWDALARVKEGQKRKI